MPPGVGPDFSKKKPVQWMGSSRRDIREMPEAVRQSIGKALGLAQVGKTSPLAKPLRGFCGASVMEITEREDGDTYRAVYTVRFSEAIYVLHAFQKKSKQGTETPKEDMDLIRRRLKEAEHDYKARYPEREG